MCGGGALNSITTRAALLVVALAALAAIYHGTVRSTDAHHLCPATGSPVGAFDIQTYEALNYKTTYAQTLELAATNKLFPELSPFALPRVETGERAKGSTQTADPYVPPVILKAIAYLESGWAQGSYSPFVDYGQVGPVLASHDCGYGIMQVTTGMQNVTGVPNLEQAMIGSHYAFNIAKGVRILSDKWNQSPELRPVIGTRDPTLIENWYYAIWGYNGWAYSNHPLNASYSPTRAPFSCGATTDGFGHDKSQYPYQELVLGCVARPPVRAGGPLWPGQEVHMPDLNDPQFAGPMNVANWNACSYSAQCQQMDIPTPNTNHKDTTVVTVTRDQVIGAPAMALSTSTLTFGASYAGTAGSQTFQVSNAGTGVLGYRASSNASWLKVMPSAGVALGADLQARPGTVSVTTNSTGLAPGSYSANVKVDSLYGSPSPQTVTVTLTVKQPFEGARKVGDFTGDGRDDVIFLCCSDTANVWIAKELGDFTVSKFNPWPGYGLTQGQWQVGDFSGDGKDDLLHLCCSDTAMIWRSRGDGTFDVFPFSARTGYPYQSGGQWVKGDFTGDGRTDFMHTVPGSDTAFIWRGRPDGAFAVGTFNPWPGYGVPQGSWKAGDFNGDGKTDLLHFCCSDFAYSWVSRGDGTFDIGFVQAWPGYGMQTQSWEVGDFDGDGKDDLAHLCCPDYGHLWYGNNGTNFDIRLFRPWAGYQLKLGSWHVGDLNGDGKDDLIHRCCADYVHPWLGAYRGEFAMRFYQPWPGYGVQSPFWESGDFNGDGRTDLLHLCCTYAHGWLSYGDGTFGIYRQDP